MKRANADKDMNLNKNHMTADDMAADGMAAVNGVLFDLDGVLIDSETSYTRFWNGIEEVYPTGIPDYALAIKGTTLSKILESYPEGAVRDDIIRRIHEFEDRLEYHVYPGVYDFLESLREAGVKRAIVTSSDKVKMGYLAEQLPGLLERFDGVVDGSMVSRSKPDPEPYQLGAARLGLKPEECVVFEDSFQGMASGEAAGCRVIGVCTTFPRERVLKHADCAIDGFEGLDYAGMCALVSKP